MIAHPESVSDALLEILFKLAKLQDLRTAALGRGTSLALVFGHRRSLDLDFFFTEPFDSLQLQGSLATTFKNTNVMNRTPGSLCIVIDKVKVDFLYHPYPLLKDYSEIDGVRILSIHDLAAMKINAVANRGAKKDFSDLLLLHENGIQLQSALEKFCKKYGQAGRFLAIRSLNWFGDTASEPDPVFLNGWTWPLVRSRMEPLARSLIADSTPT